MTRPANQKSGSPIGSLLVGVSLYALAAYWPELAGAHPGAADQLYLGFFKFIGAMAMLGGLAGYYKAWRQRQKRKAAEAPSGTVSRNFLPKQWIAVCVCNRTRPAPMSGGRPSRPQLTAPEGLGLD